MKSNPSEYPLPGARRDRLARQAGVVGFGAVAILVGAAWSLAALFAEEPGAEEERARAPLEQRSLVLDPYRLPRGEDALLPSEEGAIRAALGGRGAAALVGAVSLRAIEGGMLLSIYVRGAGPGPYRVRLLEGAGCPREPPPPEVVSGEIPAERRAEDATRALERSRDLGTLDVSASGEGSFEATVRDPIFEPDLDPKRVAVLLEERSGRFNPSLGDAYGLVGCATLTLPRAPGV